MLGLKAKAGLLFFVSAGIFTGVVVFGNTIAREKIHSTAEKQPLAEAAQRTEPAQNLIGPTSPLEVDEPENINIPTASANASVNLTQNLASLIGKSIVDKNPEGPVGDNLTVMGADGMADAAINESLKQFNPAYFSPEIPQSELRIDDAQTASAYRAEASRIISMSDSLPPPPISDPVASQMKALAKRYGAEASALYALAVPRALVTEHMTAIQRAVGKERIFEAVADYENDPIYAMLALKLLETLK